MKQQELIELVRQHHPRMGVTEIRAKLNRAQNDFCARTEIIKRTYTQLTTAGKRYYTLDKDIIKILKVFQFYGTCIFEKDTHLIVFGYLF